MLLLPLPISPPQRSPSHTHGGIGCKPDATHPFRATTVCESIQLGPADPPNPPDATPLPLLIKREGGVFPSCRPCLRVSLPPARPRPPRSKTPVYTRPSLRGVASARDVFPDLSRCPMTSRGLGMLLNGKLPPFFPRPEGAAVQRWMAGEPLPTPPDDGNPRRGLGCNVTSSDIHGRIWGDKMLLIIT